MFQSGSKQYGRTYKVTYIGLYMAGVKGEKRNQSQYDTHKWCHKCSMWREGKPHRCPDCNHVTRHNARFKTHGKRHYSAEGQHRY